VVKKEEERWEIWKSARSYDVINLLEPTNNEFCPITIEMKLLLYRGMRGRGLTRKLGVHSSMFLGDAYYDRFMEEWGMG